MAEIQTSARPYAQAVFELAQGQDELESWSKALAALSEVVAMEAVQALLDNPRVPDEALAGVLLEACGDAFDQRQQNLLRLLVENGRLELAGAIAERFEELRAEAESRIEVEVFSAVELDSKHKQVLSGALAQRLGREVVLNCKLDPDMLGGAVIRAGDLVIDGSVNAELEHMKQTVAR